MASSYLSGKNVPKDITEYPLIGSFNPDTGQNEFAPPKPRVKAEPSGYVKPAPVFTVAPQFETPDINTMFLGVADGVTESLFWLGMDELSMLVNVGAHAGILGVPMTPSAIIEEVGASGLGEAIVRKALKQLSNSQEGKREHKKSTVVRDRALEMANELGVSFSPLNIYSIKEGKKALIIPPKGGGRPEQLVRIPTEGEWDQVFRVLVEISTFTPEERRGKGVEKTLAMLASIRGRGAFDHYLPEKHLGILESKQKFVGVYMAQDIFEGGKDEYSAWAISKRGAKCPKTAKKYLKAIGVDITPNPAICKEISFDDIPYFPEDLKARDELKKARLIPGSAHLQDENRKQFAYTISGGENLKASGVQKIYFCFYPMSTYDGDNSPYNPYRVVADEKPVKHTNTTLGFDYEPGIQTGEFE